ncbi:MAG: DUF499 domain-containing protein [Deltaproteobacteria bacterium]|jgi:predicted AAA+ superfamily ATPase|nr:DUF499 domain-containing protein [Deltaproteobacteria bacterium]
MPDDYQQYVHKGFVLLLPVLKRYISLELHRVYRSRWWTEGVLAKLGDNQKIRLKDNGTDDELLGQLDIQRCLHLIERNWRDVFKDKLSFDHLTWVRELISARNKTAHLTSEALPVDDVFRAVDTMSLLAEQLDSSIQPSLEEFKNEIFRIRARLSDSPQETVLAQSADPGLNVPAVTVVTPAQGGNMKPWRNVVKPRREVYEGTYQNADFAAKLDQVANGSGPDEYSDPAEFFTRTYLTNGLSGLLVQSLKRLSGKGGEPVIKLQTPFGGGKTHSMLALYHLMNGKASPDKMQGISELLGEAGLSEIPKASIAVVVGTALDPASGRQVKNIPGVKKINTVWGEIASQLAASSRMPNLYDYVREADKKGTSPGSKTLREMFDACGSCLILLDEVVAYARKIYGVEGLPSGSFGNFLTFVQELTEAADASAKSLIVATIPESDIEIGGEAGQKTLDSIDHVFGRQETVLTPVAASEGFEIVRRRLFEECPPSREQLKEHVCASFSSLYRSEDKSFPLESKELEYKRRLLSCYPIHPEIFDRLYGDWSTLERFQRTRGVLRFMAAVIHHLWTSNDASLLIMPASIPLYAQPVRNELARYLPETWKSIIDKEVDGNNSIPFKNDHNNARFGEFCASRRIARTILLGSAPTVRGQEVRGIESSRIRLGAVQPGENISVYNDSLDALRDSLSYLYSNGSKTRFWYDTRPTLQKTVRDRMAQFGEYEINQQIMSLLKPLRPVKPFSAVHVCPTASSDIPDEQAPRLVVLHPSQSYRPADESSPAISACSGFVMERGNSSRINRNMLYFLAPDHDSIKHLAESARAYLAWNSISFDARKSPESGGLNLDQLQLKEVNAGLAHSEKALKRQLNDTYLWIFVPESKPHDPQDQFMLERHKLTSGTDDLISSAVRLITDKGSLITALTPDVLELRLSEFGWPDASSSVRIGDLWGYFCAYCYFPKLAGFDVLKNAVDNCVAAGVYGIAEAFSSGNFTGLVFGGRPPQVAENMLLVKNDAAVRQLEAAKKTPTPESPDDGGQPDIPRDVGVKVSQLGIQPQPGKPAHTRFFLKADINPARLPKDIDTLFHNVIVHLQNESGVKISITLYLNAECDDQFSSNTESIVDENCNSIPSVKDHDFTD